MAPFSVSSLLRLSQISALSKKYCELQSLPALGPRVRFYGKHCNQCTHTSTEPNLRIPESEYSTISTVQNLYSNAFKSLVFIP